MPFIQSRNLRFSEFKSLVYRPQMESWEIHSNLHQSKVHAFTRTHPLQGNSQPKRKDTQKIHENSAVLGFSVKHNLTLKLLVQHRPRETACEPHTPCEIS